MKKSILTVIMLSLLLTGSISAQNLLNGAESAAFHADTDTYYISSFLNQRIIKMDLDGNQSIFKESVSVLSNVLVGDTLFVTAQTRVLGFNVLTGDNVLDMRINNIQQLDGIDVDGEGNIYVVESRSSIIFKLDIENNTYSEFAREGLAKYVQDICYDPFNDRFISVAWAEHTPVQSIDIATGEVKDLTGGDFGRFDGVTVDKNGFIYLSTHKENGSVIMYDNDFIMDPVFIKSGYNEPAGLDYNIKYNSLAVPTFAGNEVDIIELPDEYIYPWFDSDKHTGHMPLEISFTNLTFTNFDNTSYKWDFNNDGEIDSEEESPKYVFTEPGKYSVKVIVASSTEEKSLVRELFINVFDGESGVKFENENEYGLIVNENIDINDNFTIEFLVNPAGWGDFDGSAFSTLLLEKEYIKVSLFGRDPGPAPDNTVNLFYAIEGGDTISVSAEANTIVLDEWQHIAITFDGSNGDVVFYRNGRPVSKEVLSGSPAPGKIKPITDDSLFIGNNSLGTKPLLGSIDELRFWEKTSTSDDIFNSYNSYPTGTEEGLSLYLKFNEGYGDTLINSSSNTFGSSLVGGTYIQSIDIDVLTDIEEKEVFLYDYKLNQNYPNPFNPTTNISYSLTHAGNVTLSIYNSLGEKINDLVSAFQSPGNYDVSFSGKSLASGVYFYRLQVNNFTNIKKMVLIK